MFVFRSMTIHRNIFSSYSTKLAHGVVRRDLPSQRNCLQAVFTAAVISSHNCSLTTTVVYDLSIAPCWAVKRSNVPDIDASSGPPLVPGAIVLVLVLVLSPVVSGDIDARETPRPTSIVV